MTATEMKYAFNVGFDSIANFSSPGYEDREISLFLTQAQQNIFLDLLDPISNPRSSANKQELNKIVLAELIKNSGKLVPASNSGTNLPNGQFVTLPLDFFFPLSESGEITFNDTSYYYSFTDKFPSHISSNIYIRPMTRLEYNSNIWSHIRKPNEDVIWRMEYQRTTPSTVIGTDNTKVYELIGDSTYSITGYTTTYYRRLNPISVINSSLSICELDPFIHQTIVNDAIRIAAAAIKDQQKYQTATIETQNDL